MKILILVSILLICSSIYAQPDISDLYNDALFEQSRQQIGQMEMVELDEFRNYLSSCGTHAGGETKRFFCEQSARSYVLKYGQEKPLEKLIIAMAEVEFLIDIVDAADEAGQAKENLKMKVFRDLDRYIVIREMMEATTRQAYKVLLK